MVIITSRRWTSYDSVLAVLVFFIFGGILLYAGYTVPSTPDNQSDEITAGIALMVIGVFVAIIVVAVTATKTSQPKPIKQGSHLIKDGNLNYGPNSQVQDPRVLKCLGKLIKHWSLFKRSMAEITDLPEFRRALKIARDPAKHGAIALEYRGRRWEWEEVKKFAFWSFYQSGSHGIVEISITD